MTQTLQMAHVVEDAKVGTEMLLWEISKFEYVESVDVITAPACFQSKMDEQQGGSPGFYPTSIPA